MTPPRVLFVTGEYPPASGGVGDYTARLRAALEPLGVRTSVLTLDGARGTRVHTITRWGWRTDYAAAIAAEEAQLIHIQYQAGAFAMHPSINALPALLSRRSRRPLLTTFHDLRPPYLFPKAGRLRGMLMHMMARHSAAAVATNPADERVLTRAGIDPIRIPIGPNLPAPSGRQVAEMAGAVAYFGFPARSKGIVELIAALGRLSDSQRLSLVLIGAAGTPSPHNDQLATAEVDDLAARAGVRLTRTGYLGPQDASDALASAAISVLPFRDGASQRSGSLLAALQSGRPVVSTVPTRPADLGSLATLPQLLLAPPNDAAGLAAAITRALIAAPASASLSDEFCWETIARQHVSLYRRLLCDTEQRW